MSKFQISTKMEKEKKYLILEVIIYTLLAASFVVVATELQEYFRYKSIKESGLIFYTARHGFGLGPLLLGIGIATFLGLLFFQKSKKTIALKWSFIIVLSSILSIFIQVFVVYLHHSIEINFGDVLVSRKESIINLPILLALFTCVFVGSKAFIKNFKSRILLK